MQNEQMSSYFLNNSVSHSPLVRSNLYRLLLQHRFGRYANAVSCRSLSFHVPNKGFGCLQRGSNQ